ncbi:MAG: hypothetical protein ACTHNR_02265 [Trinickia sp.]
MSCSTSAEHSANRAACSKVTIAAVSLVDAAAARAATPMLASPRLVKLDAA